MKDCTKQQLNVPRRHNMMSTLLKALLGSCMLLGGCAHTTDIDPEQARFEREQMEETKRIYQRLCVKNGGVIIVKRDNHSSPIQRRDLRGVKLRDMRCASIKRRF
jgi:hypothetical protein